MNDLIEKINEAASVLRDFLGDKKPVCALVLGSGLNFYADELEQPQVLPYGDVAHMKVSTADGHKGQFVLGRVAQSDAWVLCMQGRFHSYEGITSQEVAFPIWVMHACGVDTLVTTNAAGALNPAFEVGSFCVMTDHINMTGRNPIACFEASELADRFVPMMGAYDEPLRQALLDCAQQVRVQVNQGVYLGLLGPSFETPAEVKLFASWGADTVAMSVIEEVIAARHVGMRVLGMSLISNMGCGIEGADPSGEEVNQAALRAEPAFRALMNTFLPGIPKV